MAAIDGKITMTTCEGRPCWVKGRRAIFHRWTDSARPVKPVSGDQDTDERLQKWSVHGLVEYEDGRVDREWPNNIRFADSAERFDSLEWEQMEARRDACDHEERAERPAMGGVPAGENPDCQTCAHSNDDLCREYRTGAACTCTDCPAWGCICKTCTDSDKWEPKEAAHG